MAAPSTPRLSSRSKQGAMALACAPTTQGKSRWPCGPLNVAPSKPWRAVRHYLHYVECTAGMSIFDSRGLDYALQVHEHGCSHLAHLVHRRRQGHPALPRLPHRGAGGQVQHDGGGLPGHLRQPAHAVAAIDIPRGERLGPLPRGPRRRRAHRWPTAPHHHPNPGEAPYRAYSLSTTPQVQANLSTQPDTLGHRFPIVHRPYPSTGTTSEHLPVLPTPAIPTSPILPPLPPSLSLPSLVRNPTRPRIPLSGRCDVSLPLGRGIRPSPLHPPCSAAHGRPG